MTVEKIDIIMEEVNMIIWKRTRRPMKPVESILPSALKSRDQLQLRQSSSLKGTMVGPCAGVLFPTLGMLKS